MTKLSWVMLVGVGLIACSSSSSGTGTSTDAGADTGSACPNGQPMCETTCCDTGAVCVDDGTGNHVCAASCTLSSQCPAAKGCCTVMPGMTGGVCLPNGTTTTQECLCQKATDCQDGCCAPITDSSGFPTAQFACKKADGAAYDCCVSNSTCTGTGDCCVSITGTTGLGAGSFVCEKGCQLQSDCGSSTCQPLTSGMCATKLGSCVAP